MFPAMHPYAAVLAVSSPAHLKSRTSSGRVMEGFAAGVPVISDDNAHVRSQFGDLVYYFEGRTEQERADSIQAAMDEIRSRPEHAIERVREAQSLISSRYCFEVCLEKARDALRAPNAGRSAAIPAAPRPAPDSAGAPSVDVFLVSHDPYAPASSPDRRFGNLDHVLQAMRSAQAKYDARFRLLHDRPLEAEVGIESIDLSGDIRGPAWEKLRLGEKLARLASRSTGDFAVFLTQSDYPQHDYFEKALEWFRDSGVAGPAVHISGFYVNALTAPAALSAAGILRNNASIGLYRWKQDSIAEHQLGQFCFNRSAIASLRLDALCRFDVLLPVAIILDCQSRGAKLHRSRHLLLRAQHGYYHRYLDAFSRVASKGMWAQQYELPSNASHEIHGLYDLLHEFPQAVAIADKIYGIDVPPPPVPAASVVHPEVHQVSQFLNQIGPYVIAVKSIARALDVRNWVRRRSP
jgi:hypothetical protein